MTRNDIVYFVDKGAKYYFDMRFIEKVHLKEFKTDVYRCEILMNDYKFNDPTYAPNFDLRGHTDCYSILSLVTTKEEAENLIK